MSETAPPNFIPSPSPRPTPREWAALFMALVAAAVPRLIGLARDSLWMDEGLTAWLVKRPWWPMILGVREWEQTPPAFHTLEWGWVRLFGYSEFSLRLPGVLLGIWAVYWIWRLGRESFGPAAGLVAGALLALSPYHVHYSRDARAYSLLVTAGLASTVYFLRCLRGGAGRSVQTGYVVATTILLYSHLYGGFVAVAEVLTYLAVRVIAAVRRRPWHGLTIRRWATMFAAIAIGFGPWVNIILFEYTWLATSGFFWIREAGAQMITRSLVEYWGCLTAAAVATALAIIGLWRGRLNAAAWLAVLILLFSLPLPVAISAYWAPLFWPRYGIMALVGTIVLMSAAVVPIAGGRRHVLRTIATAALLVAAAVQLLTTDELRRPVKSDWRGVAADLTRDARSRDDLIVHAIPFSRVVFDYYWRRTDVRQEGASDSDLHREIRDARRVWVVMHHAHFTPADLEKDNRGWRIAETRSYREITVVRLEPRGGQSSTAVNANPQFAIRKRQ